MKLDKLERACTAGAAILLFVLAGAIIAGHSLSRASEAALAVWLGLTLAADLMKRGGS